MHRFDAISKNISGVEPRPDLNLRRGSPLPHPPPFGANPSASLVTCASPPPPPAVELLDSPIQTVQMAYEEKETSYVVRNASGKTVVVALLRETVASFTDTVFSPV